MKKIIILTLLLTLFLVAISTATAADLHMNSNNNTIANAVANQTNNGDTIYLDEGTYNYSHLNGSNGIWINKNLTIIGKSANETIIDAQNLGRMFNINNNGTFILINITLKNGIGAYEPLSSFSEGGAIYNRGTLKLTNCIFPNNNAQYGGAIYNLGLNLTINNTNFTNNSAEYGSAIYNAFSNTTIINTNFTNNNATLQGGAIFVVRSNITINNTTFINNTASQQYGGAIYNVFTNTTIINTNFTNNKAQYGGAVFNENTNSLINNTNFVNNSALGGSAIYSYSQSNMTINNSNFTNNNATGSGTIYTGGNVNKIESSNIFNNSHGIFNAALNTTINYNRIFNNTVYDLNTTSTNINANFNWWGNNTPDKIFGITPNNHFIMAITNLTSLNSNGTVTFQYIFQLNNNDSFNVSLLPYFVTDVYTNLTNGIIESFDARYNKIFDITLKSNGNVLYTFVTDNEIQNLEGKVTIPQKPTEITVNNPEGKNGETVTLAAKLADENGNPLAGKEVTFHIAGKTITAITNSEGIATIQYTINKNDFINNILTFTVTFEGDENYTSSNTTGTITLTTEPEPPEPTPTPAPNPEPNNGTNDNSANASMKSTGLPINLILIVLLSLIGFGYYRKQ